jgi:DNA-binding transcriptional LysR family regulator
VADAESELRTLLDGDAAMIRCGAFSSATAALLPDAVSTLRTLLPHAVITIVESDRRETLDGIRRDELDLGVVARAGSGADPLAGEDIERIPLFVDAIDVVMSTEHPLAGAPALVLDDLAREAWAECDARPVRRFVTSSGFVPRIVFEGPRAAMLRVVAEGGAVCLLPRLGQGQLPPGVVAKPIAPDRPSRRVEIAVRATDTRSAVRTFARVLREAASTHRAESAQHDASPVGACEAPLKGA